MMANIRPGHSQEARLGSSVEQTVKLQLSDKGLPFCAFLMVGN